MTRRLYYADSYLKDFSASVLERRQTAEGPAVILDQTAFYPESGGQPFDTGFLNDARVLSVVETDEAVVLHLLDREIQDVHVSGQIDWPRRFDHMQQHTGQHILSQAFIGVAGAQTLSFHMGAESSTIDIDLAQPQAAIMEEAQKLATSVVFDNRAVNILTADRESLGSLGVRKESRREGEIRVIDVEGFDRSACGGTHVRSTGEIGLVFVMGFERYKGGTRVEFVAGQRALKLLHRDHELLKRLARTHSATLEQLPEVTERLAQEKAALSRENALMQERLLEVEAAELLCGYAGKEGGHVVCRVYSGRKLETIKTLAQKMTAKPGVIAILGIEDACQVVVARSQDRPGNCGEAIRKIAAELGGKGGGRPELAQAGGIKPEAFGQWMNALEKSFAE